MSLWLVISPSFEFSSSISRFVSFTTVAFISEGEVRVVALRASPILSLLFVIPPSFEFSSSISRFVSFTAITLLSKGKIRIITLRAIPISAFFVIVSSASVITARVSFRVTISSTTTILSLFSWSDFNRRADCVGDLYLVCDWVNVNKRPINRSNYRINLTNRLSSDYA